MGLFILGDWRSSEPEPKDDDFLRQVLVGTTTYSTFTVAPMLMLGTDILASLRPVRTVLWHFAPVYSADDSDFSQVFGVGRIAPTL